jgi:FtsZ-binding cell division protein ZapB
MGIAKNPKNYFAINRNILNKISAQIHQTRQLIKLFIIVEELKDMKKSLTKAWKWGKSS